MNGLLKVTDRELFWITKKEIQRDAEARSCLEYQVRPLDTVENLCLLILILSSQWDEVIKGTQISYEPWKHGIDVLVEWLRGVKSTTMNFRRSTATQERCT